MHRKILPLGWFLLSAEGPSTKRLVFISFCSLGETKRLGDTKVMWGRRYASFKYLEVQRLIRFMPKAVIAGCSRLGCLWQGHSYSGVLINPSEQKEHLF